MASAAGARDTIPIRWLEISVPAHAEAVEAVSEILGRVGYNGVAVEEPLEPAALYVVKAYLVHDHVSRIRVRRVRDALGHLQAFGLGPIGDPLVREIKDEDWLETGLPPRRRVGQSTGARRALRPVSSSEGLARSAVEGGSDDCEVVGAVVADSASLREYWRSRPLVFSFSCRKCIDSESKLSRYETIV